MSLVLFQECGWHFGLTTLMAKRLSWRFVCFECFGVEVAQEVELGRMVPLLIEVQTEEFCVES